ncbi:hypothetical protein BU23DRAFT_627527 [Bimuria novae-zelandiae CBS 107.79]|uniref:Uncharacterized protein n=1 Tax=Bimuria novae-zelandiae CBS 107.79 TaxID=1447943 RepID=A0A6A5UL03_9PLEO|nr:hypothetical protein BU23DRAFT_627527 [Bimuria novae-zelandiae CBS 107.79]
MSLQALSLELRHQIYTHLVFSSAPPPASPPIITFSSTQSHYYCKASPSPGQINNHFLHTQTDPVQDRGSMVYEHGTGMAYLSTPAWCVLPGEYRTLRPRAKCECEPRCAGPRGVHALLLTSTWLATEVRAWLYPLFVFQFSHPAVLRGFAEKLGSGTKKRVRAVRLCIPIYSFEALDRTEMEKEYDGTTSSLWEDALSRAQADPALCPTPGSISQAEPRKLFENRVKPPSYRGVETSLVQLGFAWKKDLQSLGDSDLRWYFPALSALHVNLLHISRTPTLGTRIAAPVGDKAWREEAMGWFAGWGVAAKEVSVVVENVSLCGDVWSGDANIRNRREVAGWLRGRLLEGAMGEVRQK